MIEELRGGVILVGTAHVAASSVAEVEQTIRGRRPAKVLVELDPRRLEALKDPEAWQRTDIVRIIREKKQHLFLLQLYLASVQAQMGRETGVAPGAELLRAVQVAEEVGAEVVLIDRDIAVTLKRGFGSLGFWARMRLFYSLWAEVMTPAAAEKGKLDVEALLKSDAITQMTEEFARVAPPIKTALIDERDDYMASHIAEQTALSAPQGSAGADAADAAPSGGIVAVVGAGHLAGIKARLGSTTPPTAAMRAVLDQPPPPRVTVGQVVGWAIPLAIVAFFVYLAVTGRFAELREQALAFVLITGGLSALGCILALGHPIAVVVAFLAAPIGVLHPLLATGWFAGLAQAWVRKPTVADFQAIKQIETMRQFWSNGVVRVLLVTALTNVGAMVSTAIVIPRFFQAVAGGG
ncbi:MAG TPA: TraB/GumN family protein [Candidatus Thermoplasmatota archaeon]|nr:TraB/GumN family protein [Candidatus Thermoplasmatota archaeon]